MTARVNMNDASVVKQLKIKTGVVKRLVKEHSCYIKEVEKQAQKIEKMKAEATNEEEEYVAKKAVEVLQETRNMIGDTARRCAVALEELKKLVADSSLEECQELTEAKEQINSASNLANA